MSNLFHRIRNLLVIKESQTLEKVIFNEIMFILSVFGFLTGVQNLIIDFPIWLSLIFFMASLFCIFLLFLVNRVGFYTFSTYFFFLILYLMTIASWFYNGGLNGTVVLFLMAILIYTIGIHSKKYIILFFINIVVFASLTLISYFFPDSIKHSYGSEADHVLDMLITYIIGGLSIVLILRTIFYNYNIANSMLQDQNKKLEEQNTIINKQAKELEQLIKTKDKVFSIIGHDLRSPISSILGISEFLDDANNYVKSHSGPTIHDIVSTSKNTLDLLDNLLSWGKIQANEIDVSHEEINLSVATEDVIDLLESSAILKGISITKSFEADIKMKISNYIFQTLIRNLLSNAIKFTLKGGKIDVSLVKLEDAIEITVADNGVGMAEDVKLSLFKKDTLVTTVGTANEKGAGLGLFICYEFVQFLGGEIVVTSMLGVGTEFKIIIPK